MPPIIRLLLCLAVGFTIGQLYKAEYQSEAHWENKSCAEIAEVGLSAHPQETKDVANIVYAKQCK